MFVRAWKGSDDMMKRYTTNTTIFLFLAANSENILNFSCSSIALTGIIFLFVLVFSVFR